MHQTAEKMGMREEFFDNPKAPTGKAGGEVKVMKTKKSSSDCDDSDLQSSQAQQSHTTATPHNVFQQNRMSKTFTLFYAWNVTSQIRVFFSENRLFLASSFLQRNIRCFGWDDESKDYHFLLSLFGVQRFLFVFFHLKKLSHFVVLLNYL